MTYGIAVNKHILPIAQNSLGAIVVNPVMADRYIIGIVSINSDYAIFYLEAVNFDIANWGFRTSCALNHNAAKVAGSTLLHSYHSISLPWFC